MLEADMGARPLTATSPINVKRHMGVITFESFCESYWSHFPEQLTRGLGFYFSCVCVSVLKQCLIRSCLGIQRNYR